MSILKPSDTGRIDVIAQSDRRTTTLVALLDESATADPNIEQHAFSIHLFNELYPTLHQILTDRIKGLSGIAIKVGLIVRRLFYIGVEIADAMVGMPL